MVEPVPWVDGLTIGAVLRQTARRFAAREALIFPQARLRWTWAEFDAAVDRAARGLLALGFQPGDHFGVWSTNWPEWVVLQFATARIGAVLVTINPGLSRRGTEICSGAIRGPRVGADRTVPVVPLLQPAPAGLPGTRHLPARPIAQRDVPEAAMAPATAGR